jgi:hypothetical protein
LSYNDKLYWHRKKEEHQSKKESTEMMISFHFGTLQGFAGSMSAEDKNDII